MDDDNNNLDSFDMKYKDITAVILAGGRNTRMGGSDKAMLLVEGRSILERSISVLKEIFEEIIIVTNDTRTYNYDGVKVVKDEIKNIGPLGGIYTGLCSIKNEAAFFVACDMPFLQKDVILKIVGAFKSSDRDALLPRAGDRIEPLCAVYKSSLKEKIYNYLRDNKDYAIKRFIESVNAGYLECENDDFYAHAFKNVNTPEDARGIMPPGRKDL